MAKTEEKKRKTMADPIDLISQLPDCILSSIISLLPTIECASTSILSPRWRNLWTTSPLHIDTNSLRPKSSNKRNRFIDKGSWCISVINHILPRHRGPILSFHLSHHIYYCLRTSFHHPIARTTLNRWVETLAQKGIQDLSLLYNYKSRYLDLSCQSLRSLELVDGDLREPPLRMPPNLTLLKLKWTRMTDGGLSHTHILSGCRFLDSLVLEDCPNCEILHISSPCLRKLKLKFPNTLSLYDAPLLIEDAPNLEVLMLSARKTKRMPLKVFNAPKLTTLRVLHADAKMLQFGQTCFQHKLPINLSTHVHSVKALAIIVNLTDAYQAKTLAGLLRCFPCLETLDVQWHDMPNLSDRVDIQYWEQEGSFYCLDHHLKLVKLKGFFGRHYDLDFARFIIRNARVLKVMSLFCHFLWSKKMEETNKPQLLRESRASLDAQLIFYKDLSETHLF